MLYPLKKLSFFLYIYFCTFFRRSVGPSNRKGDAELQDRIKFDAYEIYPSPNVPPSYHQVDKKALYDDWFQYFPVFLLVWLYLTCVLYSRFFLNIFIFYLQSNFKTERNNSGLGHQTLLRGRSTQFVVEKPNLVFHWLIPKSENNIRTWKFYNCKAR